MSYSIFLYLVLLVLFYTSDRNSWSRYVRHYLSFFPANIENNRHKWKFFEKEKVQYLLIGQKANYLLNKQSRAKIWYTHFHIWRNFRSTKHWICFHTKPLLNWLGHDCDIAAFCQCNNGVLLYSNNLSLSLSLSPSPSLYLSLCLHGMITYNHTKFPALTIKSTL